MERSAVQSAVSLAATGFLVVLLLAHLVLLPLGHWGDEFETFAWYRAASFSALYIRLRDWSPRPLSEALIFLYAALCERARRPLFTAVLSACWLAFLAPSLIALLHLARRCRPLGRLLLGAQVAIAVPTLSLIYVDLGDSFLWPMSALAYLPGIASVTGLLFVILFGAADSRASWLLLLGLGVAGALFVEMAAMVSGIFFSLLLLWTIRSRPRPRAGEASVALRLLCCLLPMLAAACVGLLIVTHRASVGSPLVPDHVLTHRVGFSLRAALPLFLNALGGKPASIFVAGMPDVAGRRGALACYAIGLVLLGGALARDGQERSATMLALLAIAILLACYVSIALTLYQFDVMCCERHDTARSCFEVIALTAIALGLARRINWLPRRAGPISTTLGIVLVSSACLVLAPARLEALATVARQSGRLQAATKATWRDGWDPSRSDMVYRVPPAGLLIGAPRLEQGDHDRAHETSREVRGMLNYFNKDTIRFEHLPAAP